MRGVIVVISILVMGRVERKTKVQKKTPRERGGITQNKRIL